MAEQVLQSEVASESITYSCSELLVFRYSANRKAVWGERTSSSDTPTAVGLQHTLEFSKPHKPPHKRLGGLQYWFLLDFVCACECESFCMPAFLSGCVCVFCTRHLLCLLTHLSNVHPKSRGSSRRLWSTQIEHIKNPINSLQTSNFRFVLSHLHLTQVRQDTAVQPLTTLPEEVTVALRLPVSKLSLCLSRSVVALFPTKQNNKNRAHSFNQITLSLHHSFTV